MKNISSIPIRFSDIDVMGHVNNAVYLTYFEQARIAFFSELIGEKWDWNKLGILLAKNEVEYLQPVLLNDQLTAETKIEKIGTKSIVIAYELFVERDGKRLLTTTGKSVLVCFDYLKSETIPVPEEWKAALE